MKRILPFILGLAVAWGAVAQDVSVTLTEPGTLARELGDRKVTAVSLKVSGPVNAADFKTMWDASLNGELRDLDLSEAVAESNRIPDNAFWNNAAQADGRAIKLESVVLPENLEAIGKCAFSWAVALKSVAFPSSLRQLGQSCFSHCLSLTGDPFSLPEGIEEIPQSCFMSARSIVRATLPTSIKSIGANAFYNCDLSEINFPEGLESIGDMAFYGCLLKEVSLPRSCGSVKGRSVFGLNNELESLTLPDGMHVVPEAIAENCMNLTALRLPADVKVIGDYAFANCRVLRDVSFPEGLQGIGASTFKRCPAIEELVLPSSLVVLGQQAFCELPRLRRLYCKAQYPPMCEEYIANNEESGLKGSFGEISEPQAGSATPRGIPVYVPVGTEDAYRGVWSWNYFTNIIETSDFPGGASLDNVSGDRDNVRIYARGGEIVISANPGVGYSIVAVDGKVKAAGILSGTEAAVAASPGVYIVRTGTTAAKVAL
ncbi:MAG: leucine-rich repeat domain-containing protein [Muribaculaceae bacterium]|nr:leucine-rich repeat domain-containing protein [Muribaculaceae bacterium]